MVYILGTLAYFHIMLARCITQTWFNPKGWHGVYPWHGLTLGMISIPCPGRILLRALTFSSP